MKDRHIISGPVAEYLDKLYMPPGENLKKLRERAETAGVPVILRDTERLLDVLINMVKPRKILEFGTAVGYSACFFAESLKSAGVSDFEIISLESDDDMCAYAAENIDALGFGGNISVVRGDAAITAKELKGTFDFVFVDAAKSHYREYFDLALALSHAGTVIVCDNILMRGMTASDEYDERGRYRTSIKKMRSFADYIVSCGRVVTAVFAAGDGTAVSYVK